MTRHQYHNKLRDGVLNTWRCDACQQFIDDFMEQISSSPSNSSFFSNLSADMSPVAEPSLITNESTKSINMSTSSFSEPSTLTNESTNAASIITDDNSSTNHHHGFLRSCVGSHATNLSRCYNLP